MLYVIQSVVAIVPAVALLIYIYRKDRLSHEPWSQMLKGVEYGVVSACLAVLWGGLAEDCAVPPLLSACESLPMAGQVYSAFATAAIPEESAKLLMLWLLLRRGRYFDEHFDGIVYAVCVGLGFAALENVLYVVGSEEDWLSVGFSRAVFSVPGHFFFAVFMGYYYALVHFHVDDRRRLWSQVCVWLVPVLLHGAFDSFLFISDAGYPLVSPLCYILFLALCAFMYARGRRRIRQLFAIDASYAQLQDEFLRDAERYDAEPPF